MNKSGVMAVEADAIVVGAGPAGAAFALNLAPLHRVLVLDRRDGPATRIGESLAPAARRLLTDMGLWDAFLAEGHSPCHGGRSVWGGPQPVEADNLRDLDGPGWHLDRGRFDQWLRRLAASRGAALLVPAQPLTVERDGEGWRLGLDAGGRHIPVRARLLVDAGGRGSPLARRLGARRTVSDRLVCGWVHGQDAPARQSGLTWIEAEADGWWYSAPLPEGRRVVAFHTDADLPAAADARDVSSLLRRLSGCSMLSDALRACGFEAEGQGGFCAAHSSSLSPASGDGWLAVGDAALGFDPLSSQGIFNALYTGLAAAEAADRHLSGDTGALPGYAAGLAPIRDAYRAHLHAWYGLERRWRDRPFWRRRLEIPLSPRGEVMWDVPHHSE
ncbi:FAD-binding monooxygenase (plasmid) [Azospirillum sp. B510]|uniref:NAD(P)/FAD-dependent oxidoreductase n=1 Tax=Azospirillum sp. (strain B510) TaxID=137722 RepID=UPI0001C4CFD8|nr:NAD(P)/FAD-dependent oxidoreductase [Azospirillum sp. B510]BAI76756.1 FAD-binding monooxygenase [Azospirillum sp. B510]